MSPLRQLFSYLLVAIFTVGVINPARNYERDSESHLLVYKVHHFIKVDKLKPKSPIPSSNTMEKSEETVLTSDTSLLAEAFYNNYHSSRRFASLESFIYVSFHPELLTRPPSQI